LLPDWVDIIHEEAKNSARARQHGLLAQNMREITVSDGKETIPALQAHSFDYLQHRGFLVKDAEYSGKPDIKLFGRRTG